MSSGQDAVFVKEPRDGHGQVGKTALHNVPFAEHTNLCSGENTRLERPDELRPALEGALAFDGPALVEVMADPMLT